jgi:hypothetical protein
MPTPDGRIGFQRADDDLRVPLVTIFQRVSLWYLRKIGRFRNASMQEPEN